MYSGEITALEEDELEELLDAAHQESLRVDFTVTVLARTGMRAAELAHMKRHWYDRDGGFIRVPSHEDCECSDCKSKAKQRAETMAADPDFDVTGPEEAYGMALDERWRPKSRSGVRTIDITHQDIGSVLDEFFYEGRGRQGPFDEVGVTRQSIWSRVRGFAEGLGYDSLTPHILRHTWGTLAAHNGASAPYIQEMMGHSDITSSQRYIRFSGAQLKEQSEDVWG